jgi:hypothetical protein
MTPACCFGAPAAPSLVVSYLPAKALDQAKRAAAIRRKIASNFIESSNLVVISRGRGAATGAKVVRGGCSTAPVNSSFRKRFE